MKILLVILSMLVLLNLSACSSRSRFVPSAAPDAASVDIYKESTGLGEWVSFTFKTIDSRAVIFGRSENGYKMSPGRHYFLVEAEFREGITKSDKMALIRLNAELEANTVYRVNGEVVAHQLIVWLEEKETGKVVSEKIANNWREPVVHENNEVFYIPLD